MGKWFLGAVVAASVILIGMLMYPTIHWNYAHIDVSGFIPVVQAGVVALSYLPIFFMVYLVWKHVFK